MVRTEADHAITRQRLLEAAGEEFAERGFRNATVRDICTRAGANVAAVNYHFGDKERLYAAAVHYAHLCATRHDVAGAVAAGTELPPEQRLHAFVRAFLSGILETGRPAWHAKLMAREIAEPTEVLNEIAEQTVRPRLAALSAIIRDLVGPGVPQRAVVNAARSVVGQMLFYHFARPMLVRVFPSEPFDASSLDELAAHVTNFSLTGIRGVGTHAGTAAAAPAGSRHRERVRDLQRKQQKQRRKNATKGARS